MDNDTKANPQEQRIETSSNDIDQLDVKKVKSNNKSSFFYRLSRFLSKGANNSIKEEVEDIIDVHDPDKERFGEEERNIIKNVLKLNDNRVHHVMVPRTDIISLENTSTLEDIKKILSEKEHTRMPVYKDSLDNVTGFIHIKDVIPYLGSEKKFNLSKIIREILFVPPSMKIIDLLIRMRTKRVHMALVLDEYGGTEGLVTLEDLVEEIVGEIQDEHDEIEAPDIEKLDNGDIKINARFSLIELAEEHGISFKNENDEYEFDTIGGLIFSILGQVPNKGEIIKHPLGYVFEIIDADNRSVKSVLIKKRQSWYYSISTLLLK